MDIEKLVRNLESTLARDIDVAQNIRNSAENGKLDASDKHALRLVENEIELTRENLATAKEAQAEQRQQEKRLNTVTPTGAGESKAGSFKADGTSLMGVSVSERSEYAYADNGKDAAVARDQSFADHHVVREYANRNAERDKMVVGQYGGIASQIRSLSTSGASAIVPTVWQFPIIDKARNATVAFEAGATLVPMPAKVVQVGRLLTDPTPGFRTEGSTVTASDPSFDFIQLTATTLSALTVVSMEFLQDAPDADSVVENSLAKAMALQLDQVIFYGQLAAGSEPQVGTLASPNPRGILQNLLTNASGQVLGSGTNGTAQTATAPYAEVISTYYAVKAKNEQPSAFVSNDKLRQQYLNMYDTTNQPLRVPPVIDQVPWLTTNMIGSFTQGTMTSRATDLFCGDFSKVLVGQRLGMEMRVLTERYAELGQVGIITHWRGDVQLARYNALSVYRYLQGA